MNGLLGVFSFLFGLCFSLITFILWARIGLKFFQVNPSNPLSQAIYKITNPVIHPIKVFLFDKQSPRSRYDFAAGLVLLIVEIILLTLFAIFFLKAPISITRFFLLLVTDLILTPCNIMFYFVLLRAIISWVSPDWRHPAHEVLIAFTEPLLKSARKILPDISGFDFSPILVLIGLQVVYIFVAANTPT